MKKREYRDYLQDIYDAINEVATFIDENHPLHPKTP